jgi:small subunit ribosomal protein S17e
LKLKRSSVSGLGKVRTDAVKKISREMIKRYPDRFTTDFEENKKSLEPLLVIPSIRLRNRIAGYITRLVAIAKAAETMQAEETEEAEAE